MIPFARAVVTVSNAQRRDVVVIHEQLGLSLFAPLHLFEEVSQHFGLPVIQPLVLARIRHPKETVGPQCSCIRIRGKMSAGPGVLT